MNCQQLNDHFDDYIDGICPDAAALDSHVAACSACRNRVAAERRLRNTLADYAIASVPPPDAGFFDRAMAVAVREGSRKQHKQSWLKGFASALAASAVLWLIAGDWLGVQESALAPLPQVTMALEDPRTVNLVFSSATDLADATLTVSLPAGIEIQGFQGQREISWITSLREGKNILPLKLVALSPQGGELMATLRHGDDDKTFRLQVTVAQGTS
jgi:anti-sigma factor RsiW